MKKVLITYGNNLKTHTIKDLKYLKYDKIYYITHSKKTVKEEKKVIIIKIENRKNIKATIKTILENEKKNYIFYYFPIDDNSKYSIYTQNLYYGTKIDHKIFKQKDSMNAFLGDMNSKQNMRCTYAEFKKFNYEDIATKLGKKFIIKPTNASSSVSTFTISSEDDMEEIKSKIKRKYEYVLEEYIGGNLYSVDFYCDGKNIFLLNLVREVAYIELLDKNKFSAKFKEDYLEEIEKNFLYNLPMRYTLAFNKLNPTEINFLKQIKEKLAEIKYKGFIHLEYKLDKVNKKIGFIEWGARLGGYRHRFINSIYNLDCKNLPQMILKEKDFGLFEKKKGLYFIKHAKPNTNYIGVKLNYLKKTSLFNIINGRKDYLTVSYQDFVTSYFKSNFKISLENLAFIIKASSDNFIYPFYERSDTRFDFIFSLDDDNFKKFRKNKFKIIESIGFGDYK